MLHDITCGIPPPPRALSGLASNENKVCVYPKRAELDTSNTTYTPHARTEDTERREKKKKEKKKIKKLKKKKI